MTKSSVTLQKLIDHLAASRRFDASNVDQDRLAQIVAERLKITGAEDCEDYVNHLEASPDEVSNLLDSLLDGRDLLMDDERWNYILRELLPKLCGNKRDPVRLWIIEGHDGRETYGLAVALCEILGFPAFQRCTKLFVTGTSDDMVARARQGLFFKEDLESLSRELSKKYSLDSTSFQDLRRSIVFGRHSLIADPPIVRMDLIVCRNVLPYLAEDNQLKALRALVFAMNPGAYLVIGNSDALPETDQLEAVPEVNGIFRKPIALQAPDTAPAVAHPNARRSTHLSESCFDVAPIANLLVDQKGTLLSASVQARSTFGLTTPDLNRPLQDLEISYRPVELRSLIEQAHSQKQEVQSLKVPRNLPSGLTQFFDVYVHPLFDDNSQPVGTSIQFDDVTQFHSLQDDLHQLTQQLQTANEELQSAHEELETTNEELQSTNEELQTTNEELQSTNEELETMNEELQATNIELETTNVEQRELAGQANQANNFLQAILSSMGAAVIVLNSKFEITLWNDRAVDLWGLRFSEVKGSNFFELDIGLPVEKLRDAVEGKFDGNQAPEEVFLDAINRRGKSISCRVSITPLHSTSLEGLVLLIEELQNEGHG